jgi:RHS repeat-associated protein
MSQPFGDNLQCTGTDSSPYKFGKLERDAESGDDHAQHRDYNSNPYRWLTPDPAGEKVVVLTDPQTWNLYMYSHDNPATDNDPTGLQQQTVTPAASSSVEPNCSVGEGPCIDNQTVQLNAWKGMGQTAQPQQAEQRQQAPAAAAAVAIAATVEKGGEAAGVLAELPLAAAGGAVVGGAAALIVNLTDVLVENYKGSEQQAAIESVVIVENNRILSMAKEHTQERPSTKDKHEEGQARRARDRGGEKGDARRRPPRKRPDNWKGPWPPPPGTRWW